LNKICEKVDQRVKRLGAVSSDLVPQNHRSVSQKCIKGVVIFPISLIFVRNSSATSP